MSQMEDNKSKSKRIFIRTGSIILSILMFLMGISVFLIFTIRNTTSQDNITQMVKDIDISTISINDSNNPDDNSVDSTADNPDNNSADKSNNISTDNSGSNTNEPVKTDESTISEWVYNQIDEKSLEEYGITEDSIKGIIEKSNIKSFLSEKAGAYIDDILHDSGTGQITENEVMGLIEENAAVIYEETGYQLTNKDYEKIESVITEKEVLNSISIASVESNSGINFDVVRLSLSYYIVAGLIVLMLLIALCIFIINRKSFSSTTQYIGITFIMLGFFITMLGLLINPLIKTFNSLIPIGESTLKALMDRVRSDSIIVGLIVLLLGVTVIVSRLLINKNKKHTETHIDIEAAN